MNKKAQFGNIYFMLSFIVIGLIYFAGLAPIVSEVGAAASVNLTGIDAFFFSNLNLVITFFYALGIIAISQLTS
jgi:hypothetical protein